MRIQYASTPAPPAPAVSAIPASTTPDLAGVYYCWLYYRTRGGVTEYSGVSTVTLLSGQGLSVQLPLALRKSGGDFLWIGLAISLVNDPLSSCTVATWSNYGTDGISQRPLPDTLQLTRNAHFALNTAVGTRSALPTGADRLNGQLRYVADEGTILQWDEIQNAWQLSNPQAFCQWVSSSLDTGGADRDIALVEDSSIFVYPNYTPSSTAALAGEAIPSLPVRYWIVNDTTAEIPQGTQVRLAIERDGFSADSLLSGRSTDSRYRGIVKVRFLGYVQLSTGDLDTSGLTNTGVLWDYDGNALSGLRLDKPLPAGYAYALEVIAQFSWFHFANRLGFGSTITVYPYFEVGGARYAGILGRMLGNFIAPTEQRRRIVPDGHGLFPIALPGSGTVNGYEFENGGVDVVNGVQPDLADQIVAIEAAGGNCFVYPSPLPVNYAQRAILSTQNGVGKLSPWSAPVTLANNQSLAISIAIPNRIRPDYPDPIAGYSPSRPNALQVAVFVRVGASIYRQMTALPPNTSTLSLTLSALPATASLPTPAADFGLYAIEAAPTAAAGVNIGTLPAGNYEIAAAFDYANTVTKISHTAPGSITEFGRELSAVTQVITGWQAPLPGARSRASFDPDTVSLTQLARTVAALLDDWIEQGAILVD